MERSRTQTLLHMLSFVLILLATGLCHAEDADGRTFGGLRFGAGLSVTFDTGHKSRVDSAEVVNGIVRVTEDNDVIPRLLLESHYFFPATQKAFFGVKNPGTWAWGPYVGVQSSTDDVVDAFAMGLMVGFRKDTKQVKAAAKDLRVAKETKKANKKKSGTKNATAADDQKAVGDTAAKVATAADDTAGASSFNIGLGVMLDPRVKVLGDGIQANQPLPAGETEVRYKTTNQTGIVVMFSFSF